MAAYMPWQQRFCMHLWLNMLLSVPNSSLLCGGVLEKGMADEWKVDSPIIHFIINSFASRSDETKIHLPNPQRFLSEQEGWFNRLKGIGLYLGILVLLVSVVDVLLPSSGDLRQMVYSDEVENLYEVTFRSINTFIHGLGIVAIIFGFYRTRASIWNNEDGL